MPGIAAQLTEQRKQQLGAQLRRTVAAIAYVQNNSIQTPTGVIARDILPADDLTPGPDNGWNGMNNEWVQDFSAGAANAYNTAYMIESSGGGNAADKVLGFLVVRNQTQPQSAATQVQFLNGTGAVLDICQMQGLESEPDATGYIVDFVIYTLNEDGQIGFYMEQAQQENIILEGAVGEAATNTLSVPPAQPLLQNEQEARQIAQPYVQMAQQASHPPAQGQSGH